MPELGTDNLIQACHAGVQLPEPSPAVPSICIHHKLDLAARAKVFVNSPVHNLILFELFKSTLFNIYGMYLQRTAVALWILILGDHKLYSKQVHLQIQSLGRWPSIMLNEYFEIYVPDCILLSSSLLKL